MYLGLSPQHDGELMFLVDAALTPELPVGWLRHTTQCPTHTVHRPSAHC